MLHIGPNMNIIALSCHNLRLDPKYVREKGDFVWFTLFCFRLPSAPNINTYILLLQYVFEYCMYARIYRKLLEISYSFS